MAFRIINKTKRPVMVPLNSGRYCYLGGEATSDEVLSGEVNGNEKLARLAKRNIVSLREVMERKKATAGGKKARAGKTKKES